MSYPHASISHTYYGRVAMSDYDFYDLTDYYAEVAGLDPWDEMWDEDGEDEDEEDEKTV